MVLKVLGSILVRKRGKEGGRKGARKGGKEGVGVSVVWSCSHNAFTLKISKKKKLQIVNSYVLCYVHMYACFCNFLRFFAFPI